MSRRKRAYRKRLIKKLQMERLMQRLKLKEKETDVAVPVQNVCDSEEKTPTRSAAPLENESSESRPKENYENMNPLLIHDVFQTDKRKIEHSPRKTSKRSRTIAPVVVQKSDRKWPVKNATGNLMSWLDAAEQMLVSTALVSDVKTKVTAEDPEAEDDAHILQPRKRAKSAHEMGARTSDAFVEPMDVSPKELASGVEDLLPKAKRARETVLGSSFSSSEGSLLTERKTTEQRKKCNRSLHSRIQSSSSEASQDSSFCDCKLLSHDRTILDSVSCLETEAPDQCDTVAGPLPTIVISSYESEENGNGPLNLVNTVDTSHNNAGCENSLLIACSSTPSLKTEPTQPVDKCILSPIAASPYIPDKIQAAEPVEEELKKSETPSDACAINKKESSPRGSTSRRHKRSRSVNAVRRSAPPVRFIERVLSLAVRTGHRCRGHVMRCAAVWTPIVRFLRFLVFLTRKWFTSWTVLKEQVPDVSSDLRPEPQVIGSSPARETDRCRCGCMRLEQRLKSLEEEMQQLRNQLRSASFPAPGAAQFPPPVPSLGGGPPPPPPPPPLPPPPPSFSLVSNSKLVVNLKGSKPEVNALLSRPSITVADIQSVKLRKTPVVDVRPKSSVGMPSPLVSQDQLRRVKLRSTQHHVRSRPNSPVSPTSAREIPFQPLVLKGRNLNMRSTAKILEEESETKSPSSRQCRSSKRSRTGEPKQ